MGRSWSFGQKVAAGFALNVVLTMLVGVVAIFGLGEISDVLQKVADENGHALVRAAQLDAALWERSSASRAFLLTGSSTYQEDSVEARAKFMSIATALLESATTPEERALVTDIQASELTHHAELQKLEERRRGDAPLAEIAASFDTDIHPLRLALAQRIAALVAYEQAELTSATAKADARVAQIRMLLAAIVVGTVVTAGISTYILTRALTRQVASAVQQVRSSSAELQTAANQQATGTREQASAMIEITTTINELLATSRQIAESAQRVSGVAGETAGAARAGDQTVSKARESIESTRRQVDTIVTHMLDLGRKSQQIGGILDIVSELSDQTNILAINATIEAAGAGEAGRRFGVVADEIRKLADRVGASTKEIRGLIGEVRAAVNTTVMATESGSKAADASARQFGDVTASLERIGGLVETTTEAAREIVLSTKQQATAVEQVNIAIVNVTQATRETEASSGQTLQTATELARLSRELTEIVRPSVGV
jgi:methyl-accepting chemotaxis protein